MKEWAERSRGGRGGEHGRTPGGGDRLWWSEKTGKEFTWRKLIVSWEKRDKNEGGREHGLGETETWFYI